MRRLSSEGYTVGNIPGNGAELLKLIMEKKAFSDFRWTSVEDIVSSGGCVYQMPAKGIMVEDFDSSLPRLRDAIRRADSARQIHLEEHIFGQNPDEEEIRRFIPEVWQSEGLDDSAGLEGYDFKEIKSGLLRTTEEMDNLMAGLAGSNIPAGESGMPDENGRSIIPTGRNMFGMQIDKVPSKTAWERGVELAEQLLEQNVKDEGRLPEQIAMNMISLDVTRSAGEQLSQFLYLIGVSAVWDKQGRVNGLRAISLEELKRPRIDVTVRFYGVLRDTWPSVVTMMDEAVLMIANLDEPESQNYIVKHIREYIETFNTTTEDANRAVRIFGDPPGAYGIGIDLALLASAWKDEDDLVKYFAQSSAFAYGKGLDGAADIMHVMQNTFSAQILTECLEDSFIDKIAEETINNKEFRQWLDLVNPYALEEIGPRLLELESRGKWIADKEVLERLKQNYLLIEGDMEGRLEPKGDIQGGSVEIVNHQCIAQWEAQLRDTEIEMANSQPSNVVSSRVKK